MATYPITSTWRAPKRRRLTIDWKRNKVRNVLLSVVLVILAIAAGGALWLAGAIARLRPTIPTVAQIASYRPVESTTIYSSDGTLLAKLQIENRRVVKVDEIAKPLRDATVAV